MSYTLSPLKLPVFSTRNTTKTILSKYSTSPENEDCIRNIMLSSSPQEDYAVPSKKNHVRSIQREREKFMKKYFSKELEMISKNLDENVILMKEGGITCKFIVSDYMLDINKVEDTIINYFRFLGYSTSSDCINNEIQIFID